MNNWNEMNIGGSYFSNIHILEDFNNLYYRHHCIIGHKGTQHWHHTRDGICDSL